MLRSEVSERILLSWVWLCHHLLYEGWHGQVRKALDLAELCRGLGPDHLPSSLQLLGVVHLPAAHHQLGLQGAGQRLVDILGLPPPGRRNRGPGLTETGLVVTSNLIRLIFRLTKLFSIHLTLMLTQFFISMYIIDLNTNYTENILHFYKFTVTILYLTFSFWACSPPWRGSEGRRWKISGRVQLETSFWQFLVVHELSPGPPVWISQRAVVLSMILAECCRWILWSSVEMLVSSFRSHSW